MSKPDSTEPDEVEQIRKRLSRYEKRFETKSVAAAAMFNCGEVITLLTHIQTLTAELERLRELLPDDYELADREAPLGYNALTSLKGKSQ